MKVKDLQDIQKRLRLRILEVSFSSKTSHIGSCISAVDIIYSIYEHKRLTEKFILSNGHAGVALYAVLEKNGLIDKKTTRKLHVHPDRNPKFSIDVSTGSLGQGLPIAVGMALSNRNKKVYCMISDGECSEGSIWEALRVTTEHKLENLIIFVNANGWGAYDPIHTTLLIKRLRGFLKILVIDGHNLREIDKALNKKLADQPLCILAKTSSEQFPFLQGQDTHYYVMTKEDLQKAREDLNGKS